MKFIMIVAYIYTAHTASLATAEYNDKQSCIKAGEAFKYAASGVLIGSVYYSCTEKGFL